MSILRFNVNEPVEVALRYTDGKLVEGQYGEQWQFSLTSGDVMYVEPLVKEMIRAKGIQAGECFFIEKRKKGRQNDWHVYREAEELAPVERPAHKRTPPAVLAERLPEIVAARNAGRDLEQQLKDSITLVNAKRAEAAAPPAAPTPMPPGIADRATPPQDRWKAVLLAQTNALTDVLAEALKHGAGHGGIVKTDDVRSLLITAFIELSKRQGGNRAA